MSAASRERFAQVVRTEPLDLALACCLVAAEVTPDVDPEAVSSALDELAAGVAGHGTALDMASALSVALGARAGFAGAPGDYDDLRSSLLPDVLRRRTGLPLLLSVVWVEVARRAGIEAVPVGLPGKVVVRVGPDGDSAYVDPYAGGIVIGRTQLEAVVLSATGGPLLPEHLRPTTAVDLLLRLLTNVRALTARQDRSLAAARTRLWAVELSLLLPRHPLELRLERGSLLVRLGDHLGGARELEAWAEVVDGSDPDAAEQARRQARLARACLN
ncbi:MAG: putative transcriptional regulator [Frankiales bacterium]|nr:putative transcriptional regulator [Frankiales bacterium]